MKRPLLAWLIFAACALTGLGVLAWFSHQMLHLENGAAQARAIAAREESVRLALWRIDSAAAAIHALEAARPATDFRTLAPVARSYSAALQPLDGEQVLTLSPLVGYTPPFTLLHLEVHRDGSLSSPQAPEPSPFAPLLQEVPAEFHAEATRRLDQARAAAPALLAALTLEANSPPTSSAAASPPENPPMELEPTLAPVARRQREEEARKNEAEFSQRAVLSDEIQYNRTRAPAKLARSYEGTDGTRHETAEVSASSPQPGEASSLAGNATAPAAMAIALTHAPSSAQTDGSSSLLLRAAWIQDNLFLLRPLPEDAAACGQAVWLDWTALRANLLARIADLLPKATLEPINPEEPLDPTASSRRLAFLPVRLQPGPLPPAPKLSWSPARTSLAVAWALAALGVAAFG